MAVKDSFFNDISSMQQMYMERLETRVQNCFHEELFLSRNVFVIVNTDGCIAK